MMAFSQCSPATLRSAETPKQWTREKPTVTGWYWICTDGFYEIVRVVEKDADHPGKCALLVPIEPGGEGETIDLKQMDVEWYGPVDIPATSSVCAAA
jgi:hypothetical protein